MRHLRSPYRAILISAPALVAVAVVTGAVLYAWLLADLPPTSTVETRLVRPTTQILDRNGRLLYEVIDPDAGKQLDLSLDQLPEACIQATLATEDSRFFYHPGIDPIAIARAAWQNMIAGGEVVSGASTLTQQLARTLLMEPEERYEQSLRRKLREAWLATRLEFRYTKDELLALYLNQSYYGNWAYGIEAAAQAFYAKPAAQLSRAECAVLAGLIQYPFGYNPLQHPETAKERQLTVLRLMEEAGYLTAKERAQAASEPLRFRSQLFDIEAPHFVMYVQSLLGDQLGTERLSDGGLRVTTTLDLDLQHQAEAIVRRRLDQLNCRAPGVCDELTNPKRRVDNAAAVVLDSGTGEILAMVGSPDYFDPSIRGNVNAALSLRQPGSAIKPLTYAAALDPVWAEKAGQTPLTPASIIADLPATFYVTDEDGGQVPYAPQNYDRSYHGPVSVRTALANSYNIPAVKVLEQIGVESLQAIAAEAGIRTFIDEYGLALTLGGGEVKLLELTSAYGVLDDGVKLQPTAISKIEDQRSDGEALDASARSLIFDLDQPDATVISSTTAHLITNILSDSTARMPAFGATSVLDLPFDAAVKTGTTTDWRDNWTVGYSTERIVGVWVGNADNSPMLNVSGVDGAGPIWHDLMLAAHPVEPADFGTPDGIVEMAICAASGLLPTEYCPNVRYERFIAETEPTESDDQFRPVAIDSTSDQNTLFEPIEDQIYWHLGPEYREWMEAQGIAIAPATHPSSPAIRPTSPDLRSLILAAPASNIAYQIHPGVSQDRQRIKISGYVSDSTTWAQLRLVKDGEVLVAGDGMSRIESWWTLEPGEHQFWLEGRASDADNVERTEPSLVVVELFEKELAQAGP